MALTYRSSELVMDAYRELFNEWNAEFVDRKEDGGYEAIRTIQDSVSGRNLEKLVLLSKQIGNSFCIRPNDDRTVIVSFF